MICTIINNADFRCTVLHRLEAKVYKAQKFKVCKDMYKYTFATENTIISTERTLYVDSSSHKT